MTDEQTIPLEDVVETIDGGTESVEEVIERLAALDPIAYDRVREEEAKRIACRVGTLDAEVSRRRPKTSYGDNGDAGGLGLFEPDLWPDPVDGEDLLDRIVGGISRHVVLPAHRVEVAALWVVHAHAPEYWRHTPRLSITAPEKGCGKSTLLDVLSPLVPRAIKTENLSTAVLFRAVDKYRPTLLIDEVDSFLRENEELRGCLNAGHAQGGRHLRCEGDSNEIKAFKTFAPAALAGIGDLPATLADRSLTIVLQKRRPDEYAQAFRDDQADHLRDMASQCARWVADHETELRIAAPAMPKGIENRLADNWRPLFGIADIAGGAWPERVRAAAIAMSRDTNDDAESVRIQLLGDIRTIFDDRREVQLSSEIIVNRLHEMEDRFWPEYGRQRKPITKTQVARLLRPFRIIPGTIRDHAETFKGYKVKQFDDAFARYLPSGGFPAVTPSQSSETAGLSPKPNRHNSENVTDGNSPKPAHSNGCDGVTDEIPDLWEDSI
jgi:putative DNA primase/helicase